MMSWSCPFHSFQLPLMSLSFFRYVRFIFHVCPVPSCRWVSLSFVSLSFPLHSPCFHFCPFHVPFSSPLFPFHFPLLSCHVDFLFPPLISLHFLAFPLCSPGFPAKKHGFSSVFAKRTSKTQSLSRFLAKGGRTQTSKEPAGGFEAGTRVLRHRLPELPRGTWGNPPLLLTYQTSGGGLGGVILYLLLGVRHASAMPADKRHVGVRQIDWTRHQTTSSKAQACRLSGFCQRTIS